MKHDQQGFARFAVEAINIDKVAIWRAVWGGVPALAAIGRHGWRTDDEWDGGLRCAPMAPSKSHQGETKPCATRDKFSEFRASVFTTCPAHRIETGHRTAAWQNATGARAHRHQSWSAATRSLHRVLTLVVDTAPPFKLSSVPSDLITSMAIDSPPPPYGESLLY